MISGILDQLADLHLGWLAAIAFLLPFGETVALLDLVAPGEIGLVFIGAAAGTPRRVMVVYVAGVAGAFCGDSVSWYLGRRWGVAVLSRFPRIWSRAAPALERAATHFDRHGGRSIFLARFVGALRALVPLLAGSAGMPYRRFAPWNVAASVVWVGLVVSLGAVFGDDIAETVDRFSLALSVIVVVGIGAWWLHRRRAGD